MNITIKPYENLYVSAVAGLMNDFHDYLVGLDPDHRLQRLSGYGEKTLEEELKAVQEKNGYFPLAFDGDKLVGFGICVINPPSTPEMQLGSKSVTSGRVEELYIIPEYRGKGLAKMLMIEMEAYLKSRGCEYVHLGVFAFNENAHEMYEHLGYKDKGIDMMKKLA